MKTRWLVTGSAAALVLAAAAVGYGSFAAAQPYGGGWGMMGRGYGPGMMQGYGPGAGGYGPGMMGGYGPGYGPGTQGAYGPGWMHGWMHGWTRGPGYGPGWMHRDFYRGN